MHRKILIIAAHPDDEVLGCGGTIARHIISGDSVHIIFLSDGETSRNNANSLDIELRKKAAINAGIILGITEPPIFLQFPDNRMDSIELLDIIQKLETIIYAINPEVIYTHHSGDLNIDHQVTYQAVMTASRPLPGSSIKEIYSFEVLSSTELSTSKVFIPNYFVDISDTLKHKISALKAYNSELNEFPYPRSIEAISAQAKYRGASVGINAAEAFSVQRLIFKKN